MGSNQLAIDLAPVSEEEAGLRLDKFLALRRPDMSRARLQALLAAGHVTAMGRTITEASLRVKPGESYNLVLPEAEEAKPKAQAMALDILYEDTDLLVLDKPAGLVVHPAPGNPDATLVNALLAHCGEDFAGIGGVKRPGIVHRLDKDTAGLMVVAKNDRAHQSLARQFAERSIDRAYYALVWGVPKPAAGKIEGNIGRNPANRKKMALVKRGGKPALTLYKTLERFGTRASLVECRLKTGRTHQIRVHLASIGHPLLGDPVYGRAGGTKAALPSALKMALNPYKHQALQAFLLGFEHPATGARLVFQRDKNNYINELISLFNRV